MYKYFGLAKTTEQFEAWEVSEDDIGVTRIQLSVCVPSTGHSISCQGSMPPGLRLQIVRGTSSEAAPKIPPLQEPHVPGVCNSRVAQGSHKITMDQDKDHDKDQK